MGCFRNMNISGDFHNVICRQRKLEEALLFRGQLKDALQSMLDWLNKVEPLMSESAPVHGDLDNVNALNEHHKVTQICFVDLSIETSNQEFFELYCEK